MAFFIRTGTAVFNQPCPCPLGCEGCCYACCCLAVIDVAAESIATNAAVDGAEASAARGTVELNRSFK